VGVNSAKTVTTAVGVVGTVLLFIPPLMPIGGVL